MQLFIVMRIHSRKFSRGLEFWTQSVCFQFVAYLDFKDIAVFERFQGTDGCTRNKTLDYAFEWI